jgi:hypothetical protein
MSSIEKSTKSSNSNPGLITPLFVLLVLLSSVFATISPTADAQETTVVDIGGATLDHDKIAGPRWIRVNFDPLITGTHTIRVAWDGDADIRFSVFQVIDAPPPGNKLRIGTTSNTATPEQWSGSLSDSEQYYLGVWAAAGSATFNATVEAEIASPLEILAQPAALTVTEGDDATFTVSATGSGTLSYQWYADGIAISGATDSALTISPASLSDNGTEYTVEITDDNESITSAPAVLTVEQIAVPLVITTQPADQTVTEGDDATFTVSVTGSGILSYQWYADGVAISGATNSALTISPVSLSDSGTEYTVEISDQTESITSAPAVLTVEQVPVTVAITTQPADQTVTEGDDATFTVSATGSGTLSYQWHADGAAIAGATDSALVVSAASVGDSGTVYTVAVTDDNGTVVSAPATLTVNAVPLEIVTPPVDLTVLEGDDATFTVTATGNGVLSYQWFADGEAIVGATDSTLTLSAVALGDSGTVYMVQIADEFDSSAFASAMLTVIESIPLEIVTPPADLTVTEGEDATFSVTATGSGTLSYQWFADTVAIAGATASTLTLSAVDLSLSGTVYMVQIVDDFDSSGYASATLTVIADTPLVIVSQPADVTVTEGDDAVFSVAATGSGALSYQWFEDSVVIPGATQSALTLNAVTLSDTGSIYSVEITDANGTILSNEATLVVNPQTPVTVVSIGQGTLDSAKVVGPRWLRLDFDSLAAAMHTITVSWDSGADVRFRVFESNGTLLSPTVQGTNPGVWSGELDANAAYYIALWSANGIANYNANIEATVPVSIDSQPSDLIVTEGDRADFVVEASGSGTLTYQWLADGVPLPGENANTLTVFTTTLAEDGVGYTVEVSNGVETVTSDAALLTVNEPLVLGLFSQAADTSTWMLEGPAPTFDYQASATSDAWGRVLLRTGDLLLVGGDFTGIKPTRNGTVTNRPFLAAFDAVSGQPVSTFQVPSQVNSVVRALGLSPDGNSVYVGGDFGLLALDSSTGQLELEIGVTDGNSAGRVFDLAVTNTQLYIGGDFTKVDNTFRANIARLSLDGVLDSSWTPQVTNGFSAGRSAPVQSLTVSPSGDTVYVGGNFEVINSTPVSVTPQNGRISLLAVSALDGTVQPERFSPNVGNNAKGLTAHDIAVTDSYVIVAWGGPNYVSFHALDGTRLKQYRGKGDVQALQVVGDHVFVGHHGEFFDFLPNPIPQEAVVSLDPEIIKPFKLHSFRIDDPSFPPEQAWTLAGPFGVWGIAASEDSIWITGQMSNAGSNERPVDALVRFSALD